MSRPVGALASARRRIEASSERLCVTDLRDKTAFSFHVFIPTLSRAFVCVQGAAALGGSDGAGAACARFRLSIRERILLPNASIGVDIKLS